MQRLGLCNAAALTLATVAPQAQAEELSLAYFMGPGHPMNAAVFTPFAEALAEASGGELTVQMYPAGALNSSPPRQYGILLDGVADIAFALPGYTGEVFPMTNAITMPGVCESAADCTAALLRARDVLEQEYEAEVLAIWANAPPVLITRDVPVRTLEDLEGLLIRVTASQDGPFAEALGASAVAQPVTVINQNLTNGVIDAIAVGPSAIPSFNLHEPANYITTWFPGSGSAFVLLMNREVYDGMTEEQQGWIDEAASDAISIAGGEFYDRAGMRGLQMAEEAGVELIEISEEERARWNAAVADLLEETRGQDAGPMTMGEVMDLMMSDG